METFDCDYNNLAAYIVKTAPRRPAPEDDIRPLPGDFFYSARIKALMRVCKGEEDIRYYSLREWQEATGKDLHSVYKHPRYVDPFNRDFRLRADSPNIRAGENKTNIGALGVE